MSIKKLSDSLFSITFDEVSFILHTTEEKLKELLEKIKKKEEFIINSLSNKKIYFRKNKSKNVYEVFDTYTNKADVIDKLN